MTPFEAGLHSLGVAAFLFLIGYLITGAFAGRWGLSVVARLALAVPTLLAFVCVLAIAHIATGGDVLSRPAVVRTATGLVLVSGLVLALFKVKRHGGSWRDTDVLLAIGFVGVAVAIWCVPIFTNLPLSFHGDVKRHMAWAAQLSAGHTTPTGVITGEIPNYYPWLFHAFASFTSAFTPGGRVLHTLGPLQVLVTAGSLLCLFATGRELFGSRIAAGATALFGAITGGFGFLLIRNPTLVMDPRSELDVARFNGDFMFLRSYNLAFHNLAPPFPRDYGFLLLVAMILLLTIGYKRRSTGLFVAAGCSLGLIGLMTGESVIVGGFFAAILIGLGPGIGRVRAALALVGAASAVYAVWLVPIAINYARLGGFNDTSGDPVTLSPLMIGFSWGIGLAFALIGLCAWRWWRTPIARIPLSFVTASVIAVTAAGLAPRLGEGFTTLGRHHRYWPLVYLSVALVGGLGAEIAWRRLKAVGSPMAIAAATLVVGAAIASPLLGSIAASRLPVENADLAAALGGDESNILNALGGKRGERCEVAAPVELSRTVPAYTGARLVYFPSGTRNPAGIRWPALPDAISDEDRLADHRALISKPFDEQAWRAIVDRYGLDLVVRPQSSPPVPPTAYPQVLAAGVTDSYVLIHTGKCS